MHSKPDIAVAKPSKSSTTQQLKWKNLASHTAKTVSLLLHWKNPVCLCHADYAQEKPNM